MFPNKLHTSPLAEGVTGTLAASYSSSSLSLTTHMCSEGDTIAGELTRLQKELDLERRLRRKAEADLQLAETSVAALRESETYFRHLTEYSLDLIIILESDGMIRFESHSVASEFGYNPEEHIGQSAFDFIHPDDSPRVIEAFRAAVQTHGSTALISFRVRHKDGSYRIVEGRANNLLSDPAVAGMVFNARDVTEQRRLEDQLRHSQKVQAIGQLTAGLAHDFNNILTAIIGYSDLALAALDPHLIACHQVGEIRQAAHRAAGLTRQLLAFSRKQVLQPQVLNLRQVLAGMDKMLRRLLGDDIGLVIACDPKLGNVKADLGQLEQVVVNLAANARDAMEGVPGAKLTVELYNVRLDQTDPHVPADLVPGEYVELTISDNGCGMRPEVMSHLFEPFFTTKPQGKGSGLGLATCHGIVKQSGGHVAVYSDVGRGTTFKVYLPRIDEELQIKRPAVAEQPKIPTGRGTILLVEDEPMVRELGRTVLEELGYEVIAACNGKEALSVIGENGDRCFDLLFTDVVMPEMGGRELADKLRPLCPNTKVIFCSGYTEDAVFHSGALDRGVYFLQKPYTVAGIAQKVSDVLAGCA
jgi:two-component system cell cycle sensor histidine kinase/response regulator CckA